jgi:hydroxylamine reductase
LIVCLFKECHNKQYSSRAAQLGKRDGSIDRFSLDAAFATLTNVNFSDDRFVQFLKTADEMIVKVKEIKKANLFSHFSLQAKKLYESGCAEKKQQPEKLSGAALWRLKHSDVNSLVEDAKEEGDIIDRRAKHGDDVVGMQEMILYGLKVTIQTFFSFCFCDFRFCVCIFI